MTVALEAGGTFSEASPKEAAGGSRVIAVCGRDGVGKSKLCAALLELGEPPAQRAPPASPHFADKRRLLEHESAEGRRNFSCYNHIYSQRATDAGLPQRLHLIDTPGHVDRLPLVDNALRISHGAIMVCSIRGGVDAECGRIFAAVERSAKPSVLFLNGIDEADDADGFDAALDALEQRLGVRPVVLFAPAHLSGAETGSLLLNVLDTTTCSALECSLIDGSTKDKAGGQLAAWAKRLRDQQIESLAQVDDEMMEAFVELDGEVPRVLIESALCRAAAAGLIMPLIAGSAKSGLGIDALQEAARSFIPPGDSQELLGRLGVQPLGGVDFSPEAPFLGWAFAQRHESGEDLLEVRILDGALRPEQPVKLLRGPGPGEVFTPHRVLAHGPRGELVPCLAAGPGDVVLVPAPASLGGLGHEGLVLSDEKRPFSFGAAAKRDPPAAMSGPCTFALQLDDLEAKERAHLLSALEVILEEEDGLRLEVNAHSGEHLLSCTGVLHLELLRERLAEDFKVMKLPLGKPAVPYHATLKGGSVTVTGKHEVEGKARIRKGIVHKSASKNDAWAKVELAQGGRGTGVEIEGTGSMDEETFLALQRGVRCGLERAGPGGIPVTDVRVRVLGAEAQGEEAAAAAAANAVQRAVEDASRLALLEPIVQLEVDVPPQAVDGVVEDLQHRRGEVWGARSSEGDAQVVDAEVPLREILDYPSQLQKLTGGDGFFNYRLQSYREVDEQLARKILAQEITARSAQKARA